ncbi:MAG: hypothetical protein EOO05_12600 [Chitinophagaceae bacterium]|nr:MAG: hypothetical protein EOO05_12600 [Chitinophagaceae bacterium]
MKSRRSPGSRTKSNIYRIIGKTLSLFGLSLRPLMRGRSILTFLFFAVVIGLTGLLAPGCATIVPPLGGPIDSLPPVLVKATPDNGTLRFGEKRITMTFDEYVELDNPQTNVIVSPLPKSSPLITRHLNTVTVRLKDSLEDNTTYSINFGNTIVDVNEKNPYRQFTYTFSTGRYIDSLKLSGNVKLAETGGVDTTMTIMLYNTADDSAVLKREPRYITKTDGLGNFLFRNLPPDTFYVYAIKSGGGSYQYRNKTALFAFHDSAVLVSSQTPSVSLNAYDIKDLNKPTTTVAQQKPKAGDRRIKFQTSLKDNQDLLQKFSFTFEVPLKTLDSTKLLFTKDSSYTPLTNYRLVPDSLNKTYTLEYEWIPNTFYSFILPQDFATDTLGQQLLKADTVSFKTRALADYGKLNLRFRNLDLSKNPVLQFTQNETVIVSFPITSATLTRELFVPGDYGLRLLEDRNGNGVWDPGQFPVKKQQPEVVKPLERAINIKANSNFPLEIDLNALRGQAKPKRPAGVPAGAPANGQPLRPGR